MFLAREDNKQRLQSKNNCHGSVLTIRHRPQVTHVCWQCSLTTPLSVVLKQPYEVAALKRSHDWLKTSNVPGNNQPETTFYLPFSVGVRFSLSRFRESVQHPFLHQRITITLRDTNHFYAKREINTPRFIPKFHLTFFQVTVRRELVGSINAEM